MIWKNLLLILMKSKKNMKNDTLGKLFELQKKFQSRLYSGAPKLPKEIPEEIPLQITALIAELGEILEENQKWKRWRKNSPCVDYENLLTEVVDAFHFLINIALFLGFDSNDVYDRFIEKNKKNIERQNSDY